MKTSKRCVDTIAGGQKWDSKSEDANLLRSMLENGEISPGATPKEIQQMRSEFHKYDLAKFRNGLYAMKSQGGFNLRRTDINQAGTGESVTSASMCAMCKRSVLHYTRVLSSPKSSSFPCDREHRQ